MLVVQRALMRVIIRRGKVFFRFPTDSVQQFVTSELGDRQSSHPVKNPASVFRQVFLPGVAYPGVRDNHSTLNTKTGYEKI